MQDCGYVYGIAVVLDIKVSGVGEGVEVSQADLLVTHREIGRIVSNFSQSDCHVLIEPFSQSGLLLVIPFAGLAHIYFSQFLYHHFKFLHQLLFPFLQ